MRTATRQKTVDYTVYIAKDGTEFESKDKCEHYEKIHDGTRIICPYCNGRGQWKTDYVPEYDHWEGKMGGYWNYKKCEKCNGKGYLEKKITWE